MPASARSFACVMSGAEFASRNVIDLVAVDRRRGAYVGKAAAGRNELIWVCGQTGLGRLIV